MMRVQVALFGLKHPHTRLHLKTLQASPAVSGILLFDPDPEAGAPFLGGHKIDGTFSEWNQIANQEFEVGIADYPTAENETLCFRLIRHGVHVLSEKPIARSSETLTSLVLAAKESDVILGVLYVNRLHPAALEARHLLQEGAIGRITGCEARIITTQVRSRDPGHWLFSKAYAGGGILSWLGCHYIDLLCHLLDDEIREVAALTDTLSGEEIDVEDVASLSFRFAGGALGSLQAGYQLSTGRDGYESPGYDSEIVFRGTEGSIRWDPSEKPPVLRISQRGMPPIAKAVPLEPAEGYGGSYGQAFLEAFIESIHTEAAPPATGEDALRIARVVEAAYESSSTARRVVVST